ncbi:MAG: hypothetical protein SFU56_19665 [Capsulimonadales bacterium]|nr:hypothetical protein [Capsulimonadales bacterium]
MPAKNGHLQGGKFTASHTTVIDAAREPALAASKLDCVSKISLGLIKKLPNGEPTIKFADEGEACLLAKIRGVSYLQEIRVYTTDKQQTREAMYRALRGL